MSNQQTINLFKGTLLNAMDDWISRHKEIIGDKWFKSMSKEIRKSRKKGEGTVSEVVGFALWFQTHLSQFGVQVGLAPNKILQLKVPEHLDEMETKRALTLCASCLSLQYLPVSQVMG